MTKPSDGLTERWWKSCLSNKYSRSKITQRVNFLTDNEVLYKLDPGIDSNFSDSDSDIEVAIPPNLNNIVLYIIGLVYFRYIPVLKKHEDYFGTDLVILSRGKMTRMMPDLALFSPNFDAPPAGRRLCHGGIFTNPTLIELR
ncbi:hypothetical protein AVEN_258754-1 [Araneus ventricosus]|uniref:Uncharacterized protein n=1 Tax=Araneus ventricosus TaxID=182803 RepID=A0A4Y2D0B3_ARAVE|nr:hypothetical protein AVEN_258754-1 [Araneus ventricosus]